MEKTIIHQLKFGTNELRGSKSSRLGGKEISDALTERGIVLQEDYSTYKIVEQSFSIASAVFNGVIDNIGRKVTIQEVLYGSRPTPASIMDLCAQERMKSNSTKRIGF